MFLIYPKKEPNKSQNNRSEIYKQKLWNRKNKQKCSLQPKEKHNAERAKEES